MIFTNSLAFLYCRISAQDYTRNPVAAPHTPPCVYPMEEPPSISSMFLSTPLAQSVLLLRALASTWIPKQGTGTMRTLSLVNGTGTALLKEWRPSGLSPLVPRRSLWTMRELPWVAADDVVCRHVCWY